MKPERIVRRNTRDWRSIASFSVICVSILFIVFWSRIIITIPAGHVGVLWHRFWGGTVTRANYGEGTKLIFPWDKVFLYDARLQRVDAECETLTSDGLRVTLRVSATYFINQPRVGYLHKRFGEQYRDTLIIPTIAAQVNLWAASRLASSMYSLRRAEMEHMMIQGIMAKITQASRDNPGASLPVIDMVELNVHDVRLPPSVQASIENKLSAAEDLTRHQYLVDIEKTDSQRRVIEADATRQVQQIINPGLTNGYLRWQATDALTRLALEPKSKTVVVGPGAGAPSLLVDGGNADRRAETGSRNR